MILKILYKVDTGQFWKNKETENVLPNYFAKKGLRTTEKEKGGGREFQLAKHRAKYYIIKIQNFYFPTSNS